MSERTQADAILLCGGKGTRLRSLTEDAFPKSLHRINERELILYSLDLIPPSLVPALIFAIDYKAEQMQAWIEQMALIDYLIHYSQQDQPGVLGALIAAMNYINRELIVTCNTDEIRQGLNLMDILIAHLSSNKLATMVGTYSKNLSRHRLLTVRERDNLVQRTKLKPEEYIKKPDELGIVNTGFLILNPRAMEMADKSHSLGWSGLIDPLTDAGQLNAYVATDGVYFNVGTPEENDEAELYFHQQLQLESEQK